MPTTLDQQAEQFGISPVSLPTAPSLFGNNSVSFVQAQALESNNRSRLVDRLEFRDRVASLTQKEQARVQGAAAMSEIQRLDPRDPDYLNRRNEVISRNPNAVLDQVAQGLMGLQEEIYDEADRGRQEQADVQEFERKEKLRNTIYQEQEAGKRTQAEADEMVEGFESLSSLGREKFDRYLKKGLDPKLAIRESLLDDDDWKARNELIDSGDFTEAEVEGLPLTREDGTPMESGMVGSNGRLDIRKVAKAVGEKKRQKLRETEQEDENILKEKHFKIYTARADSIQSRLDDSMVPAEDRPALEADLKRYQEAAQSLQGELGFLPPSMAGQGGSPRAGKGVSAISGQPFDSDKFLPK